MQKFIETLRVGGKTNSLGRANEVLDAVLADKSQLDELYECVFADDAWVRMRAADCLEKICRVHPDWIEMYVDKMLEDWTSSAQPSIQWHLAQILMQVRLSDRQRKHAITWLKTMISSAQVDWIVSVNVMKTLVQFCRDGVVEKQDIVPLFMLQRQHASNTVKKKAAQFLQNL